MRSSVKSLFVTLFSLLSIASASRSEVADVVYRDGVVYNINDHAALVYGWDNTDGELYVIHSAGSSSFEPNSVRIGNWDEFLDGNNFVGTKCPANISKGVRDLIIDDALNQLNAHYWGYGPLTYCYKRPNSYPGSGDGCFRCDFLVEWAYERAGYNICNDFVLFEPLSGGPRWQMTQMPDAVQTPPYDVKMTYPSSTSASSPTITDSDTFYLRAFAQDLHSGLSFKTPFDYFYAAYRDGSWTDWQFLVSDDSITSVEVDAANTVYAWRVRAYDDGGNYTWSSVHYSIWIARYAVQTDTYPLGGGTVVGGGDFRAGSAVVVRAIPNAGYRFVNWTEGDSEASRATSYSFVAAANRSLVANFVDVRRPVVAFVAPKNGTRVSNEMAKVVGTASDNATVESVWLQLNGAAPVLAEGTDTWVVRDLSFIPGSNTMRAFAVDSSGILSLTNSLTFTYVLSSRLTLLTNGVGKVNRTFTGSTLEVGKLYTITAVPAAGQLFSNWVGTITATNNPLKFVMQSNMVLQANFVPNPYTTLKGSYAGLFRPSPNDEVSGTNAGSVALTLTESGTFSGSLRLAGASLAFTGRFDVGRQATVRVARSGKAPLWLNLGFDSQTITGQVSAVEWTADLLALRRATASSNAFAGRYSMLVMGEHGATNTPPGDSPLAVTVSAPSTVTVSGTMADGSAVTLATGHSAEGTWPFYASLYGGRGLVIGWMSCATNPGSQEVLWVKPLDSAARYSAGFREERPVAVKRYLPPAPKQSAVSWSSTRAGNLIIGGGNLTEPLYAEVLFTNNLIKSLSGSLSNLSLVITNSNGRFAGSFLHPVTRKTTPLKGILVQGLPFASPAEQVTVGGGWFLGTNQGGYLWLEPKP